MCGKKEIVSYVEAVILHIVLTLLDFIGIWMFVGLKANIKNIQYDFFKWCRNSELKCAALRPLITPQL